MTYEIIVITSDDKLEEKGLKDCLVYLDKSMPARKRNIGSRLARGKYLAFFDDDVKVSSDTLLELKRSIKGNVGMSYGKLWNMEHTHRFDEAGSFLTPTGFLWSRAGQHDEDKGQYDRAEPVLSGKSASCMIPKLIFNKVGEFDEDFGILGEETDLAWRVWLSGYEVIYTPLAVGWHAFNTKFKPKEKFYTNERVFYNGCRNYITMLFKNLETKNLWKVLPIHISIWATASLLMFLTGKLKPSLNIIKGIFYPLRNLELIREKRRKVQSNRVRTDRELFPFISRTPGRSYYTQRFTRYLKTGLHG